MEMKSLLVFRKLFTDLSLKLKWNGEEKNSNLMLVQMILLASKSSKSLLGLSVNIWQENKVQEV